MAEDEGGERCSSVCVSVCVCLDWQCKVTLHSCLFPLGPRQLSLSMTSSLHGDEYRNKITERGKDTLNHNVHDPIQEGKLACSN